MIQTKQPQLKDNEVVMKHLPDMKEGELPEAEFFYDGE